VVDQFLQEDLAPALFLVAGFRGVGKIPPLVVELGLGDRFAVDERHDPLFRLRRGTARPRRKEACNNEREAAGLADGRSSGKIRR
jgi:hypothetical protein